LLPYSFHKVEIGLKSIQKLQIIPQ